MCCSARAEFRGRSYAVRGVSVMKRLRVKKISPTPSSIRMTGVGSGVDALTGENISEPLFTPPTGAPRNVSDTGWSSVRSLIVIVS